MAWCRQATSHYLSQCWPRSVSPYGITRPQRVNIQHFLQLTSPVTLASVDQVPNLRHHVSPFKWYNYAWHFVSCCSWCIHFLNHTYHNFPAWISVIFVMTLVKWFSQISFIWTHWKRNVILMKFLSLATPEVVKMTTFGATTDKNFIKITAFLFQCSTPMLSSLIIHFLTPLLFQLSEIHNGRRAAFVFYAMHQWLYLFSCRGCAFPLFAWHVPWEDRRTGQQSTQLLPTETPRPVPKCCRYITGKSNQWGLPQWHILASKLIHCDLVMPYCDINLGQHWLK